MLALHDVGCSVHRPDFVIDSTFDLFCELCATDEQCDFPVVYASGVNGIAGGAPEELADDLAPLFEAIVKEVSKACHALVLTLNASIKEAGG